MPPQPQDWSGSSTSSHHVQAEIEMRERLVRIETNMPHMLERLQAQTQRITIMDQRMATLEERIRSMEKLPHNSDEPDITGRIAALEEKGTTSSMGRKDIIQYGIAVVILIAVMTGKLMGSEEIVKKVLSKMLGVG